MPNRHVIFETIMSKLPRTFTSKKSIQDKFSALMWPAATTLFSKQNYIHKRVKQIQVLPLFYQPSENRTSRQSNSQICHWHGFAIFFHPQST